MKKLSIDVPSAPSALFFTPYTLPLNHSDYGAIECLDPSLTVQADREQADINEIVRKFGVTKELPYGNSVPEYDDYSTAPNDFKAAMDFVIDSNERFLNLPATVRTRFDNDPGNFLDFVSNNDNYQEAVDLGVVFDTRPIIADEVEIKGQTSDSASDAQSST